ncbi:tetratricopeptide repeat protein [Flavobacterium sp.]|uniref:tetratricopeptide repeat protein n=1 Tax=Flavobacterium sp. TaxID=239 RepID=UPI00261F8861|nr:tetratricopeptide repeat protein [Flavobacterium sp.]
MKIKQIIIASTLLVSVASFSQKDELKALKKIYAKEIPSASDIADYKSNLNKLEPLATEESDKIYTNFYKCMLPIMEISSLGPAATPAQMMKFVNAKSISDLATGLNATLDFEKKTGKKVYTDDINETIASFKPEMLNYAVALGNQKKYKESSEVLYAIYQLDKKDQENLYYAAGYAVNGEDFDSALKYYKELKTINYSGEKTLYTAKNIATGEVETYDDKNVRDSFIRLKTHNNPKEEKIPSKRGEIYKNIALILLQQNKTDEAKAAISEARKDNPNDTSLILTEADLYYKLNDFAKYKELVGQALAANPNDVDLIFNLGVVSTETKQYDEAEKYYNKVIQLKPDYVNAYLNLSDLKLKPDGKIVEEMNKLGTSAADLKKYDNLKAERVKLFNSALPLLEKAIELDPQNEVVKSNLLTVYNFLELTDKYKALKAKN